MKVLVATDGSEYSQLAIDSLLQIKFDPGSQIRIIEAVQFYEPLPAFKGAKEQEIQRAHENVASSMHMLESVLTDCEVTGTVVDGQPEQAIPEEALQFGADLIVMGAHGRAGLTRFMLGSVSRAVMVSSPCPVRIVRRLRVDAPGKEGNYNILIAADDSDASDYAINHILNTDWPKNVHFRCVTAVPADHRYEFMSEAQKKRASAHHEAIKRKAASYLRCCVVRINEKFGPGRATSEILEGDPRSAILNEAENWPVDLIVMGSYGRRFLERIVVGSVSEAVAVHAPCSVEVLPIPKPSRLLVLI